MVPSFNRVAWTLKGLIEDMVGTKESRINLTPYISRTTLDIIGLVGEIFFNILIFTFYSFYAYFNFFFYFRI
jgi:hypothetical protein